MATRASHGPEVAVDAAVGLAILVVIVSNHRAADAGHDDRERQLDRLTRLLATARAVQRELLALGESAAILARACELVIRGGAFRFAWIAELAAAGDLVPVARCGEGGDYVEAVHGSVAPPDRSVATDAPAAIAIREERAVLCPDIATDARMAPMREHALARGFRSAGIFPIRRGGRTWGVLLVYAAEVGFVDSREVELVAAVAEDIGLALDATDTERRRADAEARLRASEERYRTIFEHAGDGIFLAGPDRRYRDVNPAGCRMLGYARDELLALRIEDVIDPTDLAGRPVDFSRARPGIPFFSERRLRRKDGGLVHVELHAVMLADGSLQSVARDVSEKKRTEAERAAADRVAALGRLAQGIGHEINNPLAYLSLNVEQARARVERLACPVERGELGALLGMAQDATARIAHVTRALGAFGRGDEETVGVVDLRRVLEAAVTLTANRLRHVADVVLDARGEVLVLANELRLAQVFVSLLLNAADAVEDTPGSPHVVSLAVRRIGDRVVVEVRDTGPGIPADSFGRIFHPLYTTKPAGRGVGMGLSIARSIVEDLGGSIEAESPAGGGALLRVTLPVAEPSVAPAGPVEPPAAPGRHRVLVVDDEPLVGRAVARALSGHDVTVVTDVPAALELCATYSYDCILCDLMLPSVGGDVLFDTLTARRPELAARVVFMTGGAFTAAARRLLERAPNPLIEKPFSSAGLRATVLAVARGDAPANGHSFGPSL